MESKIVKIRMVVDYRYRLSKLMKRWFSDNFSIYYENLFLVFEKSEMEDCKKDNPNNFFGNMFITDSEFNLLELSEKDSNFVWYLSLWNRNIKEQIFSFLNDVANGRKQTFLKNVELSKDVLNLLETEIDKTIKNIFVQKNFSKKKSSFGNLQKTIKCNKMIFKIEFLKIAKKWNLSLRH